MTRLDTFFISITIASIILIAVSVFVGAKETRRIRAQFPEERNWFTALLALTFLPWWPEE